MSGGLFGFVSDLLFGSPPDPSEAIKENAAATREIGLRQVELGEATLDFYKQQYTDTLPFFERLAEAAITSSETQNKNAEEYMEYWRSTYKPLEEKLVKEAEEFDTVGNRELLAQKAQADIGRQYANVQGQLTRQLGKYGINPNSGEFAALNAGLLRDKALQSAGAMTDSRLEAQKMGTVMKYNAASLGRNLPGQAAQAYGGGIAAGDAAARATTAPVSMMGTGFGLASDIFGSGASAFGSSTSQYGTDFNARMAGWAGRANAGTNVLGLTAAMFGQKFEHGGQVRGPGGPKDDAIPAMLSDGEYVVPASVVKKLGVGHFEKMIEKHGDTGNKVALAKRRAIKGR